MCVGVEVEVWMGDGCLCSPARNDFVTPCYVRIGEREREREGERENENGREKERRKERKRRANKEQTEKHM